MRKDIADVFRGFIAAVALLCVVAGSAFAANKRDYESRYYDITSDLDPDFSRELARRMDEMYDEYERRFADFGNGNQQKKLKVYLFESRDDYLKLLPKAGHNTGGVYVPGENGFLASFLGDQGRDNLRRTLQHEAFHQFADTRISKTLPPWLNEGIAQFFEEGLWTGQHYLLGQVPPRRVRQLQDDAKSKRLIRFRKMLAMTRQEWLENLADDDNLRGPTQYNQAWAMVQFLVSNPNGVNYRERLIEWMKMMHEGADPYASFTRAFSDNIEGFQERFVEWIPTLRATPEATLIENQEVMGDMLANLAMKGQQFDDIEAFRDYVVKVQFRMTYKRGPLTWTSNPHPMTYFADLQNRLYARHQLYFERKVPAPLPDVVCKCSDRFSLRTRFYNAARPMEFEVRIEPP